MKRISLLFYFLSIASISLTAQTSFEGVSRVYTTFENFEQELKKDDGKVHVVNFWATWCGPCVKELPYFEELNAQTSDEDVQVTLVSIDFLDKAQKKLVPFLKKKNLKSEIILFDDPNANDWIDKIDPSWSGAIPITVFYKGDQVIFKEQDFHSVAELEEIIKTLH